MRKMRKKVELKRMRKKRNKVILIQKISPVEWKHSISNHDEIFGNGRLKHTL